MFMILWYEIISQYKNELKKTIEKTIESEYNTVKIFN